MWEVAQFNYQKTIIEYSVDKFVPRIDAEGIKTVVLPDRQNFAEGAPTAIVGQVINAPGGGFFKNLSSIALWIGFALIISLSSYYVFYVKSSQVEEQKYIEGELDDKAKQRFRYAKQLINEALDELDKGYHQRAKVIYDEISGIYKYLPDESKRILAKECISLHSKIEKQRKSTENK